MSIMPSPPHLNDATSTRKFPWTKDQFVPGHALRPALILHPYVACVERAGDGGIIGATNEGATIGEQRQVIGREAQAGERGGRELHLTEILPAGGDGGEIQRP